MFIVLGSLLQHFDAVLLLSCVYYLCYIVSGSQRKCVLTSKHIWVKAFKL